MTFAASRTVLRGLVVAAALALGAVGMAGCSTGSSSPVASAVVAAADVVSPLDGQVVKLDTEGLTRVRGFTLRTNAGSEVVFRIGVLENGAEFPPAHLAEHMATGSPVRVTFAEEAGALVVTRIEDAPAP